MKKGFFDAGRKFVFCFSLAVFLILTTYLIIMGSFFWEGGNTVYEETGVLLRGMELIAGVILLLGIFSAMAGALHCADDKRVMRITVICGGLMLSAQFLFVYTAKAGIRYDALKVLDEAVAMFSQEGILEEDLGGYFARYSNNYAITIMTHWIIKVFRGVGIIGMDFSGAVTALQFVNVFFVDAAFAGAWVFIKRAGGIRQAAVFLIYTALNPLSYVWLPFYYTNTCSMAFAIWGAYLLLSAFSKKGMSKVRTAAFKCAAAGVLFAIGFELRATVAIALIAALITLYCTFREQLKAKTALWAFICLLTLFLAMASAKGIYLKAEDHYIAFDEEDTEFPVTHWIAMGLSPTGTFSPADEEYTMGFDTREEKKEAVFSLLKERAEELGPLGVAKLYARKLVLTFGDGAGGYHSELNRSKEYGMLWQIVYGVYRDPLLAVTQIFYLLSLVSGAGTAVLLWRNKLCRELFFFPLLLLGSYLFQMIWEAGTIYSIGTMYVNGCMAAVFAYWAALRGLHRMKKEPETKIKEKGKMKIFLGGAFLLCIVTSGIMAAGFFKKDYVEVSMSVDQFLFQANEYIALSEGMEISQTFVTDKEFSEIDLQVHNPEGKFNDSIYSIYLYDGNGNLIKERILRGSHSGDYAFCPFAFQNRKNISDYEIKIKKRQGDNDLVFLYYDTGHYDVYPEGKMTGLTKGDLADLIFRVYRRENRGARQR